MKPEIIFGDIFKDHRGIIRHTNDFKLEKVCRFYTIEHKDTKTIRAWQGHKFESKWFIPLKGEFVLAWVRIDDFENPSKDLRPDYRIISSENPLVISLPPGYANGLRALCDNSIVGVFSDMENEISVKEKIRYPADWWFDWECI